MLTSLESVERKFKTPMSDGVETAVELMKEGGFKIHRGIIFEPDQEYLNFDKHTPGELLDAQIYLMESCGFSTYECRGPAPTNDELDSLAQDILDKIKSMKNKSLKESKT